jgi:hypothetical protein
MIIYFIVLFFFCQYIFKTLRQIALNVLAVYDVANRQPGGLQCGGVFAWERAKRLT